MFKLTDRRATNISINVGGGGTVKCVELCTLHLFQPSLGGDIPHIQIKDVRICPYFGINILPENIFLERGYKVSKGTDGGSKQAYCKVTSPDGQVVIRALQHTSKLFLVGPQACFTAHCSSSAQICNDHDSLIFIVRNYSELDPLMRWHIRLGHRNFEDIAQFLRLCNIPFSTPRNTPFCKTCVEAKSTRYPISRGGKHQDSPRPGYRLHSDNCGPFSIPTRGNGYIYFNLIVDDFSRKLWVRLMASQTGFYQHLIDTVTEIEAEKNSHRVVAQFHSDAATYFERKQTIKDFCASRGIRQTFSPPDTPSLNAVAERNIRTLCEMARSMIIGSGLPAYFWGEAVTYAAYILNNLPLRQNSSQTRNSAFYEMPHPNKPPSRILPFGCAAWAHQFHRPKNLAAKKAIEALVIGWDVRRSCYRLVSRADYASLSYSGSVITNEDKFPALEDKHEHTALERTEFLVDNKQCRAANIDTLTEDHHAPLAISRSRRAWMPSAKALEHIASAAPVAPAYGAGGESMFAVSDSIFATSSSFATSSISVDPVDWPAAMSLPTDLAAPWIEGGRSEYESHQNNNTFGDFIPVKDLPKDTKLVKAADILKTKRDNRKKVRLVLKGFTMLAGVHFNQTFAPTVFLATFRILLALAAQNDWDIWQADAPTAFLQPKIDADIYIIPTPLIRHFDRRLRSLEQIHGKGKVAAKVLKGIPGIPQGSRLWNNHVHQLLTSLSFIRSSVDHGLYLMASFTIFILVWVDDLFLFAARESSAKVNEIWKVLQTKLGIDKKAPIQDCLGCEVVRDRAAHKIFLTQESGVKALQTKLGLTETKAMETPMDAKLKLSRSDCPADTERISLTDEQTRFRSVLASLIYFVMWSRPDLAYPVSALARFMHNPGPVAQTALKRVLRYLFSTADFGLLFDFSEPPPRKGVYGFYDASFADCPDSRRSTGGHVIFWNGCAVNWISKLHPYVTTSTNHSEYVAGASCARECAYQINVASELGLTIAPIDLFSDSTGSISQCYNPTNRAATKHVDVSDHYIREQVEKKRITVTYVPTDRMTADISPSHWARSLLLATATSSLPGAISEGRFARGGVLKFSFNLASVPALPYFISS